MSKGTIISEIGAGQYNVEIQLDDSRAQAKIDAIDDKIDEIDEKLPEVMDQDERDELELQRAALVKEKEYIQNNLPDNPQQALWCADRTEGLSGSVALAEIAGDYQKGANVWPGYESAAYEASRDGNIEPAIASTTAGLYYNWALRPGWQKWRPSFRHGTITAIDGDTCDIDLEEPFASDQTLHGSNIQVNQTASLSGVSIEYMNCNGEAFSVGDDVLVMFQNHDWEQPKVIGFKEEPQACYWENWKDGICALHVWEIPQGQGNACPEFPYEYDNIIGGFTYWSLSADINEDDHLELAIDQDYGTQARIEAAWYSTEPDDLDNPDFSDELNGWTYLDENWLAEDGKARHNTEEGHENSGPISQSVTLPRETYYTLSVTIAGATAGTLTVQLGGSGEENLTLNQSNTLTLYAEDGVQSLIFTPSEDFDGTIDDISLGESPVDASNLTITTNTTLPTTPGKEGESFVCVADTDGNLACFVFAKTSGVSLSGVDHFVGENGGEEQTIDLSGYGISAPIDSIVFELKLYDQFSEGLFEIGNIGLH